MGSKGPSGSTTTTVQANNPVANAQAPYLSNIWGSADWQRQNQPYYPLTNLQNYAQAQGDATGPYAGAVMPTAEQAYLRQIQGGIPSAGQAAALTANAGNAVNQGLNFSGQLAAASQGALNQAPDWQNRFLNAGDVANATLQGYGGAATGALTGLAPGALTGMSNLSQAASTAGNPAEAGLYSTANMALANPALSSGLRGLASGAYINPSTNPAYAGMIQSATQPLINQYMTATAPQVASQFEGAGRYGSGAQTNAQGQAQYGLGQALSNAVSNITNNAYNTGLGATVNAGGTLGNVYNTGVSNAAGALGTSGQLAQSGVNTAGNLLNQGYNTAGTLLNQGFTTGGNLSNQGFNALNSFMGNAGNVGLGYTNAGLSGLGAGANAAQAGYGTANTALTGAGNLLNAGNLALTNALGQAGSFATYPESQYAASYNAPWQPLTNESNILGGAVGGTGTTQTSQPYYSNTAGNILSGLSGGLGIAQKLFGPEGLFG